MKFAYYISIILILVSTALSSRITDNKILNHCANVANISESTVQDVAACILPQGKVSDDVKKAAFCLLNSNGTLYANGTVSAPIMEKLYEQQAALIILGLKYWDVNQIAWRLQMFFCDFDFFTSSMRKCSREGKVGINVFADLLQEVDKPTSATVAKFKNNSFDDGLKTSLYCMWKSVGHIFENGTLNHESIKILSDQTYEFIKAVPFNKDPKEYVYEMTKEHVTHRYNLRLKGNKDCQRIKL